MLYLIDEGNVISKDWKYFEDHCSISDKGVSAERTATDILIWYASPVQHNFPCDSWRKMTISVGNSDVVSLMMTLSWIVDFSILCYKISHWGTVKQYTIGQDFISYITDTRGSKIKL